MKNKHQPHPASVATKHFKPRDVGSTEYSPYAKAGNSDHHRGKDIYDRVVKLDGMGPHFGLSSYVSKGNRPKHTAKDSSRGSGIDDNSPRLGRKDWR